MLRWRLLLGAVLIAGLLGLCLLDILHARPDALIYAPPGGWLYPLAFAASLLATGEIAGFYRKLPTRPQTAILYLGNLAIVLANLIPLAWPRCEANQALGPSGWPWLCFALAMIVALVSEMRRYERPGGVIPRLALAAFAFAYVGVLTSWVVQLRFFQGEAWGLVALLSMIAVVKMADSGAYTLGRLFGRHKMAPVLSPGKTWEGFAGAMLFAVAGALAVRACFQALGTPGAADPRRLGSIGGWVLYGLIVGIAGLLGDLAESLLKRDVGLKDSSTWLPGFGGVLDILDSLLLAAPVAYLCWALGLIGPLGS
ncbi:MAG TPA: phosphatidate cytidylyltransferase [Pirellulales bacterium]|jgi:phosphatidate cytidylyltransferase|nr:phosphatidate cytidylyltransferase [Pirellulales bacterium]